MQEAISSIYLFLKSGHVIFMVFWMAGLFMLPRQCIYMLDPAPGSEGEAKWADRSAKLRKIILTPSLPIALGLIGLAAMGFVGDWAGLHYMVGAFLAGVVLASVNIFGGFAVTERMLAMYKKKEKK